MTRQAILIGSWKDPELVISEPLSRSSSVREDGWYDHPWVNPVRQLSKGGFTTTVDPEFVTRPGTRALPLSQYLAPLGFARAGGLSISGRLSGLSRIREIVPGVVDEVGRMNVSAQQGARVAQQVLLSTRAQEVLADVEIPSWFGLSLFPYQEEGAHALVSGRPMTADEPGLGKTRQLLGAASIVDARRLLVVCPPVALTSWAKEISASHVADPFRENNTDVVDDVTGVGVGDWVRPLYAARKMPRVPREYGAVVVSDSLYVSRPRISRLIELWKPDVLIIDESHRYKNASAQRTQAIMKLAKTIKGPVFLSSGTPFFDNPIELISQLMISRRFDPVFGGYSPFVKRYFFEKPWGELVPRNAQALCDLGDKLNQGVWVRRRKSDVLADLPEKVRIGKVVDVDLKLYRDTHREVIEKIREWIDLNGPALASLPVEDRDDELWSYARNSLPFISRLRVAAGLCKVDEVCLYAKDWCLSHPDEPIIVWAHHKDVATALRDAAIATVGADRVAAIVGDTPARERGQITQDFQAGRISILVASIQAAGVAITLTRSHMAIFAETDWTPATVIQAEDRIHRIGQTIPPTYFTFIAPGTLDETIQNVQRRKAENLNPVLGGDSNVSVTEEYSNPAAVIVHQIVVDQWAAWARQRPNRRRPS